MNVTATGVRYGFPGIVLGILLFISFPTWILRELESASDKVLLFFTPVFMIALLFVGVILHHIYCLIYAVLFTKIQDIFRTKSDSYRTYLMKSYSLNRKEVIILFRYIRDKYFRNIYTEKLEIYAAVIHLFYFTTIVSFVFFVVSFFVQLELKSYWYCLSAGIELFIGFALDRKYEEHELSFVKNVDDKQMKKAIKHLFGMK